MSKRPALAFSDPERERDARKLDASRLLDSAMRESGASGPVVAASLGVEGKSMERWRKASEPLQIGLHDVLGLPPDVLRLLLAPIADSIGLALVDRPTSLAAHDHVGLAASAMRETAEVVTAHAKSIADGRMTRLEGVELERECDDAMRPLLAIREIARQAQREGVVGVNSRDAMMRAVGRKA